MSGEERVAVDQAGRGRSPRIEYVMTESTSSSVM